jgi:hypothetical protein
MVDHHAIRRADVKNHHQAHKVARDIQAYPSIIGNDGPRGWHDRRLA